MTGYSIADPGLAEGGMNKIEWALQFMPVLQHFGDEYLESRPLQGMRIAACLHLEAKTACLLAALRRLGAEVSAAGSNPLSTQDDVCAALVRLGVHVFSQRGMSDEKYFENLGSALDIGPQIVIDDGADMIAMLHSTRRELLGDIRGGAEETTTGITRLRAMEAEGSLAFPVIAVNDASSKYLFDNRYGTGQSVMDGLMRTTNALIAGKNVVVSGYGWCGRGVAMRA
ncbi:MAG: adenosylhomocysteinase, partial [Thermovirgaceae bacterium]